MSRGQVSVHIFFRDFQSSRCCRLQIVGGNASRLEEFADEVQMWVHEEMVDGRKLTEIINQDHENVKV